VAVKSPRLSKPFATGNLVFFVVELRERALVYCSTGPRKTSREDRQVLGIQWEADEVKVTNTQLR